MRGLEALKAVLSEQVKGYRALVDVLRRERTCLIGLNAPEVEQVSKEKDTILLKLHLFEEERLRLTREFCSQANIKGDPKLRDLAEITGDDGLSSLRSQLLSLLQAAGELNGLNRSFSERTLSFTRGALDRLQPVRAAAGQQGRTAAFSREV